MLTAISRFDNFQASRAHQGDGGNSSHHSHRSEAPTDNNLKGRKLSLMVLDLHRLLHCMDQTTFENEDIVTQIPWQSLQHRMELLQDIWQQIQHTFYEEQEHAQALNNTDFPPQWYQDYEQRVYHASQQAQEAIHALQRQENQDIFERSQANLPSLDVSEKSSTGIVPGAALIHHVFFSQQSKKQEFEEEEGKEDEMEQDILVESDLVGQPMPPESSQDKTLATNTEELTRHSAHTNNKPNKDDVDVETMQRNQREQIEQAIAQMAKQMKEETARIHSTLKGQTEELLGDVDDIVRQNVDDVSKVTENVTSHVNQGWKRTFGTWTLLILVASVFLFALVTIYMIPKYNSPPSAPKQLCRMANGKQECLDVNAWLMGYLKQDDGENDKLQQYDNLVDDLERDHDRGSAECEIGTDGRCVIDNPSPTYDDMEEATRKLREEEQLQWEEKERRERESQEQQQQQQQQARIEAEKRLEERLTQERFEQERREAEEWRQHQSEYNDDEENSSEDDELTEEERLQEEELRQMEEDTSYNFHQYDHHNSSDDVNNHHNHHHHHDEEYEHHPDDVRAEQWAGMERENREKKLDPMRQQQSENEGEENSSEDDKLTEEERLPEDESRLMEEKTDHNPHQHDPYHSINDDVNDHDHRHHEEYEHHPDGLADEQWAAEQERLRLERENREKLDQLRQMQYQQQAGSAQDMNMDQILAERGRLKHEREEQFRRRDEFRERELQRLEDERRQRELEEQHKPEASQQNSQEGEVELSEEELKKKLFWERQKARKDDTRKNEADRAGSAEKPHNDQVEQQQEGQDTLASLLENAKGFGDFRADTPQRTRNFKDQDIKAGFTADLPRGFGSFGKEDEPPPGGFGGGGRAEQRADQVGNDENRHGISGESSAGPATSEEEPPFRGAPFTPRDIRRAASRGESMALREFLEQRPSYVDRPDKNDWTALHLAARAGHEAVVKELLDHGADVNRLTADGRRPLALALDRLGENHPTTILLRERGGVL